MASIRNLKKDINYLADEIVQHGLLVNYLYKGNDDKVKEVIETAISDRQELMERVRVRKQQKAEYKAIRKDMIEKADKAFQQLATLTQE